MCDYEGRKSQGLQPVVWADSTPLPSEGVHSPHGFAWGYEGAAPAELARALLRHHLGDRIPHPFIYQRVMRTVVRQLPEKAWRLTSRELERAMQAALKHVGRTCPLCADCGYRQIDGNREDACECAVGRRLFNEAAQPATHAGGAK